MKVVATRKPLIAVAVVIGACLIMWAALSRAGATVRRTPRTPSYVRALAAGEEPLAGGGDR